MSMNSVAIVICSDEILSAEKCDCSSPYLIQELNSLQYSVSKVTVIPRNESSLINELILSAKQYDIVVAIGEKCGHIYEAIGRIITQELEQNEDLFQFFARTGEAFDNEDIFLPIQAKVLTENNVYPVVHFQRIFVVQEKFLEQSFSKILKNHLVQYKAPMTFNKHIQISQNGNSVGELKAINELGKDNVTLEFTKDEQFYVFKVTSRNLRDIVEFETKLKGIFEMYRLNFLDDPHIWDKIHKSNQLHIKNSIKNIEQCLQEYGPDNIFVSFNGGKDCTVLLHLVLAVIKKVYPYYTKPLFCLYVQSEKPFPEQEEFIRLSKSYYNLRIFTIRAGIKEALHETLQTFPNSKACFMGTRRTDPFSSDLNVFQMTDSNWPQIMRVSPLLDWHYSDIWDYLLFYKVPYCELYDMGFTSLGNTLNTTRNPSLIYYDHFKETEEYLPAYKLMKEVKERHGRQKS